MISWIDFVIFLFKYRLWWIEIYTQTLSHGKLFKVTWTQIGNFSPRNNKIRAKGHIFSPTTPSYCQVKKLILANFNQCWYEYTLLGHWINVWPKNSWLRTFSKISLRLLAHEEEHRGDVNTTSFGLFEKI